jgi:hypothetical protein
MKESYKTVGKLYGYLSKFTHWGQVVHGHFLDLSEEHVGVLRATVRYRAMTLALCLIILDVLVEAVRGLYLDRSHELVLRVQETLERNEARKIHQLVSRIADLARIEELGEIRSLLVNADT